MQNNNTRTDGRISTIINALTGVRFSLDNEKSLQREIAARFDVCGIQYNKEFVFDSESIESIVDFEIDNIGVEIKIKGNKRAIYDQCLRYCKYDQISALILVTNIPMGMPSLLNGKPVFLFNLAKAWM